MATEFIYIHSSDAQDKLQVLLEEFLTAFGIRNVSAADIFHSGVFCRPETYANYPDWPAAPDFAMPPAELAECNLPADERLSYVKGVMADVMRGEVKKPEWMIWLEMEYQCDEYGSSPSTFLCLLPKKAEYSFLAKAVVDFLYSPCINTVLFDPIIL